MAVPIAGGVGVATRNGPFGQPVVPDGYWKDVFSASAQRAWNAFRPDAERALRDLLGTADMIDDGVTLYDVDVHLAETFHLGVERQADGDVRVHLLTGTCHITATSTTPTVLGSYADPRFSFAFGLDLSYVLDLPPTTQPLTATGFDSVHVLAPSFDSQNFAGDLVKLAIGVYGWLTGNDLPAVLRRQIAAHDFAPYLNDALSELNAELTELAAKGYWFLEAVVDTLDGSGDGLGSLSLPGAPAGRLDLLLTAYSYDRSGALEGVISWPAALGDPTNAPELDLSLDRRRTWNPTWPSGFALATAAALQADSGVPAVPAAEAAGTPPAAVGTWADTTLATALAALPADARVRAARETREAVAGTFVSLIGGPARFADLQREFRLGRSDFQVSVTTAVGGSGLFPHQRTAGTLAALWSEDDGTTHRRRYLVVDVPVGAPLDVTCSLAPGYRWRGVPEAVACVRSGWDGRVTVTPRKPEPPWRLSVDDLVEVRGAGGRRVLAPLDELQEAGILLGGMRGTTLERAGIIIVGGRGDEVSLNPQPLPPGERLRALRRGLGTGVTVGHAPVEAGRVPGLLDHTGAPGGAGVLRGRAGTALREVPRAAREGRAVLDLSEGLGALGGVHDVVSDAVLAVLVRHDPTGSGVVRGVDFDVVPYQPPVVR